MGYLLGRYFGDLEKIHQYYICMNISLLFGGRVTLVEDKEEVIVSVG